MGKIIHVKTYSMITGRSIRAKVTMKEMRQKPMSEITKRQQYPFYLKIHTIQSSIFFIFSTPFLLSLVKYTPWIWNRKCEWQKLVPEGVICRDHICTDKFFKVNIAGQLTDAAAAGTHSVPVLFLSLWSVRFRSLRKCQLPFSGVVLSCLQRWDKC